MLLRVISEDVAIPTRETRVVTTTTNDQGNVVISVYQGKSLVASENQFLGSIEFDTLSMGPKVEVEVEMLFEVDVNGALTVVGTEKKSKSKKEATFVASTTLDR
jgi:molecular chaperone DnaK